MPMRQAFVEGIYKHERQHAYRHEAFKRVRKNNRNAARASCATRRAMELSGQS